MTKKQYGLVIERWDYIRKRDVMNWLRENFDKPGTGLPHEPNRWGEHYDYGLENLYMDEDVYVMFCLRWL